MTAGALLRMQLAGNLTLEVLRELHEAGLEGTLPAGLSELLRSAGLERVLPVHELSEEELRADAYGFARDFQGVLTPGTSAEEACRLLDASPWVKSARPMGLAGPGS